VHDRFVLHLPNRTYEVPLPDPFCTFDYQIFCNRLFAYSDADLLHASVLGRRGHVVYTTRGAFDAGLLIDATGWRAALATNTHRQRPPGSGNSFGIETVVPVPEDGLHFWYDPGRLEPKIVTWLFPVGSESRAGIASYQGKTRLKEGFEDWLRTELGQGPNEIHGGFFPYRRRPATTDFIFRVGDSAGQCFPLTGEGIRPALYFGATVGRLANAVVEGLATESQALASYRRYVRRHAQLHRYLLLAQKILTGIPVNWVEGMATQVERRNLFPMFMGLYRRLMDPAQAAVPGIEVEALYSLFSADVHSLLQK